MKKTSLSILLIATLGLAMLSACGGGSSSSAQPPQPITTAVMTLSTAVTGSIPVGTNINSYNVTVELPNGVTVQTLPAPNSSETGTGVVTASGDATGALILGAYTAATETLPGTVKIVVINLNPDGTGFNPGEFCKLSVTVAAGFAAPAADFNVTLDDATGADAAGNTILNLHTQLSVTIK
jgi:ABC-type glycerol-3-phosphate transport system substrate-binding protein